MSAPVATPFLEMTPPEVLLTAPLVWRHLFGLMSVPVSTRFLEGLWRYESLESQDLLQLAQQLVESSNRAERLETLKLERLSAQILVPPRIRVRRSPYASAQASSLLLPILLLDWEQPDRQPL